MPKKLKILVSCYACSPYKGSEPGMGWNFIKGLSEFHELHVIVEELKWKSDIIKYLEENSIDKNNLKFYFIKKKRNKILRKFWPPSYYWYYKMWQKETFNLGKKLNIIEKFDIIHQLNMVGFREPGYLWEIKKPFVWGPIGGMENTNWKLLLKLNLKDSIFYGARNIYNFLQKSYLIRSRKAGKKENSRLISATTKNKTDIKKYWGRDSVIIPEVGNDYLNYNLINIRLSTEPLKIIWSGQHTSGKALNILLRSLAIIPNSINWELNILGAGKMTKSWKKLSKEFDIYEKCVWHGWVERSISIDIMKKGHVLCITSIKDLTSTVLLEGLSIGLPIIALDHCGFSNVVNANCGIKIPINYPAILHKSYSDAICNLYLDEDYRKSLSYGAFERSKDFSWDKKIKKINNIYSSLLKR